MCGPRKVEKGDSWTLSNPGNLGIVRMSEVLQLAVLGLESSYAPHVNHAWFVWSFGKCFLALDKQDKLKTGSLGN